MSLTDRWYPVFQRYLQQVGGRVTDLGGDPSTIEPSPSGEPARPKPGDERCVTGKVVGIIFDHFGDFEGFILDVEDRRAQVPQPRAGRRAAGGTRLARAAAHYGLCRAAFATSRRDDYRPGAPGAVRTVIIGHVALFWRKV